MMADVIDDDGNGDGDCDDIDGNDDYDDDNDDHDIDGGEDEVEDVFFFFLDPSNINGHIKIDPD